MTTFLRRLSGICAGGLAVLAVALLVVAVVAVGAGSPGPGVATLAWHVVGAALAVTGQVYADRTTGARAGLAALGVIVLVAAVLTEQWLL